MEVPDLLSAALDESGIGEEEMAHNAPDQATSASRFQFPPHLVNYLPPSMVQQITQHMAQQMAQQMPFHQMAAAMGKFPGGDKAGGMYPPYYMVPPFGFKAANGNMPYPMSMFRPPYDPKFTMGPTGMGMQAAPPQATEDAEEDEELGLAETYADYTPAKLRLGERHPDPVVETSSLSSVTPPNVWYKLSIPEEIIDRGLLSALQLEAIVYACQQHEVLLSDGNRAGFLIGDGAGVGKGRTIAGCIFENYLLGRKRAIWVSVSNDLKYDSERDFRDIGAGKIEVHSLNKFKYAKISSKVNGSVKKGVIFSTYSSLIGESQSGGKYKTRLKQLLHWCGDDFDGVIVFDECHKAKNLCPVGSSKPTKTGLTVLELQNKLPKARVIYASATGASEPKNMAYMTRLGIWGEGTPFREFSDFISAVEKRGVGAMELVAMDMKLRGMYMARQLSFQGVSFRIEEIPLEEPFIDMYDESVKLWVDARAMFQEAAELMEGDSRIKKTMWGQFWASHQRFFKYLCIASKVPYVVSLAREAVKNDKCVVIGLQSTGEARTLEQLEEQGGELTDFVSTAKGVLQTLIEKHFPAPNRKKTLKLLGLGGIMDELNPSPPPSSSTGGHKRKSARQARQGLKRYREASSGDDSEQDVKSEPESDFEPSASSSAAEDSEGSSAVESDAEDDFNPFGDDSDSDDPWASRKSKSKRKIKKQKAKKKKTKFDRSTVNGTAPQPTVRTAPTVDSEKKAAAMKQELLDRLEKLGDKLPPNTLDHLIDELGGPDNVAEMTGRKGRVVSTDNGTIQYESRSEVDVPLETLNLTEKQRFMDGEKHIAIISEAASSGISLQSDRRAKNQARRVHITLELPWSADRAVQQFGRTHRSNQVNAPEYIFLISDLAGERRFASIVAKRLESLGALTHGDRRAGESRDLSRFNIDNKYGRAALETMMRALMKIEDPPFVPPPERWRGDFFADCRKALVGVGLVNEDEFTKIQTLDKDYNNMSKFLNRILGIDVELQNAMFKYFTDTLDAIISEAKKTGRYDLGILDLGTAGDNVKRVKVDEFVRSHATGTAKTELHTVSVERGLSFDSAQDLWKELVGKDEGFYLSNQVRNGKKTAVLAVCDQSRRSKEKEKKEKLYRLYRPNTGLQVRHESLAELKSKYKKVTPDEAQPHWQEQYMSSETTCSHMYWYGSCRKKTMGMGCEVGLRRRTYHVLSGSVLAVWAKVESVLSSVHGHHSSSKLQVVRLKTEDDLRIVGTIIPPNCVTPLVSVLSQDAEKTHTETF
ncbi:protein strawberry notch homolog 1-like isoform X2 [Ornithodoros turicata]|uniref:Putative nuclear helicase mop-3/sno dead-box superfamily n=1 Tax=Ornithodoros turicata TaxID=34597 RepID=A0A2R5LAR5_9ACAR